MYINRNKKTIPVCPTFTYISVNKSTFSTLNFFSIELNSLNTNIAKMRAGLNPSI